MGSGHVFNTVRNEGNTRVHMGDAHFHGAGEDALSRLPYASQASFNSYERQHEPLCLAGTRVEILEQISEWADQASGKTIFWLNDIPGTGKSTIARTIARKYDEQGRLGASFFFSRGGGDVGNAHKFVTTIARQLGNHNTALKGHILDAIRRRDDIADRSLRDQWECLVHGPVSKISAEGLFPLHRILVIDALDECDGDDDIELILQLLADASHLPLRVFVTSRPDAPIFHGFREVPEDNYRDFSLHNKADSSLNDDISRYLESELGVIRQRRNLSFHWPGHETFQLLVHCAGGLFIYIATACRFLKDSISPDKSLRLILEGDYGEATPLQRLDSIYGTVLESSITRNCHQRDKEERSRLFRQLVGSITVLEAAFSVEAMSALLGIEIKSIQNLLHHLHSVIAVPESQTSPIRLLHPSFRDFLLDKRRCRNECFWIDAEVLHMSLSRQCMSLMACQLKQDVCGLQDRSIKQSIIPRDRLDECLSFELQYACRYWVLHIAWSKMTSRDEMLRDSSQLHVFLQHHLLHWFEAASLLGSPANMIHNLQAIRNLARINKDARQLTAFVADAVLFIEAFMAYMQDAPLQIYLSGLLFAPSTNLIRQNSTNIVPGWYYTSSESHSGPINAIAFSPDGVFVATASSDLAVILWSFFSAESIGSLTGHSGLVRDVAFSPDSKIVGSASEDGSTRFWDVQTGSIVATCGNGSPQCVVVFAPEGGLAACGSSTGSIHVEDLANESTLWLFQWAYPVRALSISTDRKLLASGTTRMMIWDLATKSMRAAFDRSDLGDAAALSPDGQLVASATWDGRIKLQNASTGAYCGHLHTGVSTYRLSFSADGSCLQTERGQIRLDMLPRWQASQASSTPYGLFVHRHWIRTDRFQDLLLCHPEFHGARVTACGRSIVVGRNDGRVSFMRLHDSLGRHDFRALL